MESHYYNHILSYSSGKLYSILSSLSPLQQQRLFLKTDCNFFLFLLVWVHLDFEKRSPEMQRSIANQVIINRFTDSVHTLLSLLMSILFGEIKIKNPTTMEIVNLFGISVHLNEM